MAGILFTSAASERGMDYPDVAWATVGDGHAVDDQKCNILFGLT